MILISRQIFFVLLYIIITIVTIIGYNIDIDSSIIFRNVQNNSYFGYSVLLHKPWIIVGAPRANYSASSRTPKLPLQPGSAYKCHLNTGRCKEVRPAQPSDEYGHIEQVNYNSLIKKSYAWFGATMDLDEDSDTLTICAPRTLVSLFTVFEKHFTMHGVCYSGNLTLDKLQLDDKNLMHHDFLSTYWYNPMYGFSVHYSSPSRRKNDTKDNRMIIGAPKHETTGSVMIKGQKSAVLSPMPDDITQFGYATSSGRFFDSDKLLFVGGGPGWNLVGQVVILDPRYDPPKVLTTLSGETIGEYFGSSLTSGDLNNDGLDDLIVGAPQWGNDEGRVYIFFGSYDGVFDDPIIYAGHGYDSKFGYSLACADLDADGFDDLIIGAPWEDNGVIYIYNGGFRTQIENNPKFQRINWKSSIRSFGFSLASPVDIDDNGFPDIATGAYKSNRVVIMKSRPVIKTTFTYFDTTPQSLQKNTTDFIVRICIKHEKLGILGDESFNLTLIIDDRFNRVNESRKLLQHISHVDIKMAEPICLSSTVSLLEGNQNIIDPIEITAIHEFYRLRYDPKRGIAECELCPIETEGQSSVSSQLTLPFKIGCGDDKVCTSTLLLSAQFSEDIDDWIIGSDDISLAVKIENLGEPAYLTSVKIELSEGITLKNLSALSCEEHDEGNNLEVICGVDNPLVSGHPNSILLNLDMSQLDDGALSGKDICFNISVDTRSKNNGSSNISKCLQVIHDMNFTFNGTANDRIYHFSHEEDPGTNISFYHSYEMQKKGATPIKETRVTVNVPVKFGNIETVYLLNEPRIFISGKLYRCFASGIPVLRQYGNYGPMILKEESSEVFHFNKSNQLLVKRNIDQPQPTLSPIIDKPEFDRLFSDNTIYLNCSTPYVKCKKIICNIGTLNSESDLGTLQLKFSMNLKKIWNEDNLIGKEKIIFVTEAWINVLKPVISPIPGTNEIKYVQTIFINVKTLKRISIWIIVGSIFLGLIALFLLAIGLRMLGFFNRNKKDKLVALKNEDVSKKDDGPETSF